MRPPSASGAALDARAVRRRFLVLRALRWLPTGLLIPVLVLLLAERGLSMAEVGMVMAAQGVLVFLLELPSGGLADTWGRRPALLLAAAAECVALGVLIAADELWLFVLVFALQGVHRAMESGPLDAWYVDAALAADERADIESGLSAGAVVLGVAVAAGTLSAGGLVAADPFSAVDTLAVPVVVALVLRGVEFVAVAVLVGEPRRQSSTMGRRRMSTAVRGAIGVVRGSTVLITLLAVELFWGFGMATFEQLFPRLLGQHVGGNEAAGVILGPVGALAWLAASAGAALVPLAARRFGAAITAAGLRVLHGATVVGMALAAGPTGAIAAYLACYVMHGAANPIHQSLLHRQVTGQHRATVLSLNSMVAMPSAAAGGVVLGWVADGASIGTAMIIGGVLLAAAAPLYWPAHRAQRAARERAGVLAGD